MKKVFISYSRKDAKYKERLVTHLNVLEKQGLLDVWEDQRIAAGANWRAELDKALNEAHVAILLVSADFLTSEFILSFFPPYTLHFTSQH